MSVIGYAVVGTADLEKAAAFYDPLLALLGARPVNRFDRGIFYGESGLEFAVVTPFDGGPAAPGNGTMAALRAPSRAVVDEAHALALSMGGRDEGAPGIRGRESSGFYGAYFRDLDGNKLCVYRIGAA